jgi:transposase
MNALGSSAHAPATDPTSPACAAPPRPRGPCPVCPRLAREFEPYRQAASWQALPQRALQRQAELQQRQAELQAKLRLREQQRFDRQTETQAAAMPALAPAAPDPDASPRRPRGQQRRRPGHGRRDYSHRPAVIEQPQLPPEQCSCQQCGRPFAPTGSSAATLLVEIEVQAYRRVLRRRRYRPTCDCQTHPEVVTAPLPARVLPKSIRGVSLRVTVLLDKYLFYRPTYRLLAELRSHDLDLSLGTVTAGLQRLPPLVEPVYQAVIEHSQGQALWQADAPRWLVFATVEGKVG